MNTQAMQGDFFARAAATPDRTALVLAESCARLSAGELAQSTLRMAHWLVAQGLQTGERFAVVLENRFEILALVLAAQHAGLYAAVLSTHLTPAEIAYIVQDCDARLVIASRKTLPLLSEQQATQPLPCWTVDEATAQVPSLHAALRDLPGPPPDFSDRPLGRDLLYSSGTTGRPKGVLKPLLPSHLRGQPHPEAQNLGCLLGMDERTVYLSPAPLYHAAPLRYTLRVLELGGQAVIMERFDPEAALALIERYRITHSQWVPTMFGRLLRLPEDVRKRHDLSSHRMAIHAAAPCPIAVKQAMIDWWGDILLEYYAGSEGCGTTMISSAEWRQRPGSVGRPTTGQLHILDDAGHELPAGALGHVYFSGGGEFSYLNDPEKTRAAINAHGWATYGDIGYVDAEGYLFLSDRRADLILSGGVNLYPQEIENALLRHPGVQDAAVVGVPHADLGEVPLAVVVLRAGVEPSLATAHAIAARAAEVLARIKLPQRMVFADALPRLETGKLLRRKLKEHYRTEPHAGHALKNS
ncbi:AMP-binding protein [Extensimonas vulgaris]|uniref:Acyl-CoA synthetase (AMP-forming)/AMP-acid ligase II n=1 Tax=Extensimonas vulgaris TaxID=1031594 RepID=A0A369ADB9_9BURK|nr:acyl-CoA synthetase (AMP-forming)/AMP-acid ligase II [Extensimonas vulgaris]TWI34840.1 acyl-CoA synthetase (AMP-forming)/AMP-acid ligase II [Extensimonas vulgaris]